MLDRAGVDEARRASAVVLATSTWNDVLPTVILEAMAHGRAVLATAVGGIPYLVGDEAGWLVEPEAAALAAALPVARDEAAGRAQSARRRYLRDFHPDVLTQRLLEIYRGITANSDHMPR